MISSKVEHFVYTERVGGSSPLSFKKMYILFSIFLIICFLFVLYFYIYLYKEIIYLIFYFLVAGILFFVLTLNYALDILKYWFNNLEESLIVQDSSDIIWVLCFISFFFSLLFLYPYLIYISFLFFSNSLTEKEQNISLKIVFILIYSEFLILFVFLNDISFSNFFSMPNLTSGFFELQIEIETYLNLIKCFFFDLSKSLIFYQLFLYLFFSSIYVYLKIKNKKLILFLISLTLFFYWFGGESLSSDFILIGTIFIFSEFIYFLHLIALNLRRIKV